MILAKEVDADYKVLIINRIGRYEQNALTAETLCTHPSRHVVADTLSRSENAMELVSQNVSSAKLDVGVDCCQHDAVLSVLDTSPDSSLARHGHAMRSHAANAFLVGMLFLVLTTAAYPQSINTPANFPDANFRAAAENFMGGCIWRILFRGRGSSEDRSFILRWAEHSVRERDRVFHRD